MKQIVLEAQCLVLKYGYLKEIKQGIRMRNGKVLCWISQSLVERNHQAFDVIYAPLYRRSHCGRLLWCCFTLIVCEVFFVTRIRWKVVKIQGIRFTSVYILDIGEMACILG